MFNSHMCICNSIDVEKLSASPELSGVVFKLCNLLFSYPLCYENLPPQKQMVLPNQGKIDVHNSSVKVKT
jgi:hypothetical protein